MEQVAAHSDSSSKIMTLSVVLFLCNNKVMLKNHAVCVIHNVLIR